MILKGKVAIVTGGAKRVGRTIALALAERGAHIVVHYRNSKNEAQHTAEEIREQGVKSLIIRGDISSVSDMKKIVQETLNHFHRIDVLVNSASLYKETILGKIGEKDWDSHINTNLKGAFFISQAASKVMLKQKSGKIVNIIDSDTERPYKNYLPYLVSKSGMVGLTRVLATELAPHIQVNAISPGPVLMQPDWGPKTIKAIIHSTPLKRIGSPQDIANAVIFCIEGTDFMTGAVIPVDGGQHIG